MKSNKVLLCLCFVLCIFFAMEGHQIAYAKDPGVCITNIRSGVKISWNKEKNADAYHIEKRAGNSYKTVKKLSGKAISYVDKDVKSGCVYRYRIKAIKNGKTVSTKSTDPITYLKRPKLMICNLISSMVISWEPIDGATSYRVYKMDGKKRVFLKSTKNNFYEHRNLKDGYCGNYEVKAVSSTSKSAYSYPLKNTFHPIYLNLSESTYRVSDIKNATCTKDGYVTLKSSKGILFNLTILKPGHNLNKDHVCIYCEKQVR